MKNSTHRFAFVLCLIMFQITACAALKPKPPIQAGDRIYLRYTCVNEQGLAITTALDKVEDYDQKADYFVPPMEPGPVAATADDSRISFLQSRETAVDFKDGVNAVLAASVAGLPYEKKQKVTINGFSIQNIIDSERYLFLRRMETFNCRFSMDITIAKGNFGEEIKVGDRYPEKAFPGVEYVILGIENNKVFIDTVFEEGLVLDHPFHEMSWIHLNEKECAKVFNPYVGFYLRSGPLVGRVTEVKEGSFITDFGDPLAGQTLTCDVFVTPNTDEPVASK